MSNWIKVSDRLPDDCMECLVLYKVCEYGDDISHYDVCFMNYTDPDIYESHEYFEGDLGDKERFVDYGSKKGFWTTDDYGHVVDENANVIAWMPIPDYNDILDEENKNEQ